MEVIILVIIMIFLFSQQKKKLKTVKKEDPVQNRPAADYRPQTQTRPVNGTQTGRTAGSMAGNMAMNSATAGTAEKKPVTGQQGKSTTEMLEEKARQDAIEHQEEKRKQLAEERRIHGQLRYAERYLP